MTRRVPVPERLSAQMENCHQKTGPTSLELAINNTAHNGKQQ